MRYITLPDGETTHLSDAAERYGLSPQLLSARLDRLGWPLEKALTTPPRQQEPYDTPAVPARDRPMRVNGSRTLHRIKPHYESNEADTFYLRWLAPGQVVAYRGLGDDTPLTDRTDTVGQQSLKRFLTLVLSDSIRNGSPRRLPTSKNGLLA